MLQLNMCFSLGQASSFYIIMLDYDHFPKDTGTFEKPTFQRWQQAPPKHLGMRRFH